MPTTKTKKVVKRHYLREVAAAVDKSHPSLGNGVVMAMLVVKCKKLLIIVSPRGCGKSRISSFVASQAPSSLMRDRLSVAGLAGLSDRIEGFDGVIVVDDIAKTQTPYARINTCTTLAELIYSHYCSSNLAKMTYEINDFQGSAIVNVQPVLLRALVASPEWEASIQDKSIRYYHLRRPQKPNPEPPDLKLTWGTDLAKTKPPCLTGALWYELARIAEAQWGVSRLQEHLRDLLRASAALDSREVVNSQDFQLLIDVMRPLQVESLVMDKQDLESRRFLYSNKLAILTEFVTYGQFTLSQLSRDYKVTEQQAYKIMGEQHGDWRIVAKSPTTYAPSEKLENDLRRLKLI